MRMLEIQRLLFYGLVFLGRQPKEIITLESDNVREQKELSPVSGKQIIKVTLPKHNHSYPE